MRSDGAASANGDGASPGTGTSTRSDDAGSTAHDDAGSSGGGGGGPTSDAAGDAVRACEAVQCLRAFEGVTTCDGPVVYSGCCACEAPAFDRVLHCQPDDTTTTDSGAVDDGAGGGRGCGRLFH